jgi:hypothetical protein
MQSAEGAWQRQPGLAHNPPHNWASKTPQSISFRGNKSGHYLQIKLHKAPRCSLLSLYCIPFLVLPLLLRRFYNIPFFFCHLLKFCVGVIELAFQFTDCNCVPTCPNYAYAFWSVSLQILSAAFLPCAQRRPASQKRLHLRRSGPLYWRVHVDLSFFYPLVE